MVEFTLDIFIANFNLLWFDDELKRLFNEFEACSIVSLQTLKGIILLSLAGGTIDTMQSAGATLLNWPHQLQL